jgi:urease accessory protein
MRGERPFIFTNLKTADGVDAVVRFVEERGMLGAVADRRARGSPGRAR